MSYKHIFINELTPFAYEKLSVATDAVSALNTDYTATAIGCFITIETNNIRYRIDGGNPDADDGHLVYAAQNMWFENSAAVRNFRAIASGGAATLIVTYYR
jgi:hypothetical protein